MDNETEILSKAHEIYESLLKIRKLDADSKTEQLRYTKLQEELRKLNANFNLQDNTVTVHLKL